jgi:small GTP-binding protein
MMNNGNKKKKVTETVCNIGVASMLKILRHTYSFIYIKSMKTLKYVFVGESGVGKSSLVTRLETDNFSSEYEATVGVEFGIRTITLSNGCSMKIQCWDTAGSELFRAITSSFYANSHVGVVVFDKTDITSFRAVEEWVQQLKEARTKIPMLVLIGNKCDLVDKNQVSTQEATAKAFYYGMVYMETSAKTGDMVLPILQQTAQTLVDTYQNDLSDYDKTGFHLQDGSSAPPRASCCMR